MRSMALRRFVFGNDFFVVGSHHQNNELDRHLGFENDRKISGTIFTDGFIWIIPHDRPIVLSFLDHQNLKTKFSLHVTRPPNIRGHLLPVADNPRALKSPRQRIRLNIFTLGLPPRRKRSTSSIAEDRNEVSRQSNPSYYAFQASKDTVGLRGSMYRGTTHTSQKLATPQVAGNEPTAIQMLTNQTRAHRLPF